MNEIELLTKLEHFGFPAIILVLISFAIYNVGKWVGKKLDPFIDQISSLMNDHKSLIQDLRVHLKRNDDLIRENTIKLSELSEKLSVLTEVAVERNNFIRENQVIYKYSPESKKYYDHD
jgi:hypothetical protein